jgi:hypothetical protein
MRRAQWEQWSQTQTIFPFLLADAAFGCLNHFTYNTMKSPFSGKPLVKTAEANADQSTPIDQTQFWAKNLFIPAQERPDSMCIESDSSPWSSSSKVLLPTNPALP